MTACVYTHLQNLPFEGSCKYQHYLPSYKFQEIRFQWLLSWLEGYLLPTWARKITCQCFDWMLQSSWRFDWMLQPFALMMTETFSWNVGKLFWKSKTIKPTSGCHFSIAWIHKYHLKINANFWSRSRWTGTNNLISWGVKIICYLLEYPMHVLSFSNGGGEKLVTMVMATKYCVIHLTHVTTISL